MSQNPYKAYSQANHTVAKTRQVVMLYDGVIRTLKQAKEAMEENRIEDRYNKLVRAAEIILGLQMSLDFEQGQEAAQALYDFYASIDSRIMQLHRGNFPDECQRVIDDVREMRDVWDKIDQGIVNDDGNRLMQSAGSDASTAVQGVSQMLPQDMGNQSQPSGASTDPSGDNLPDSSNVAVSV